MTDLAHRDGALSLANAMGPRNMRGITRFG